MLQGFPPRSDSEIQIRENRFGFEPEITAKLARQICGYTKSESPTAAGPTLKEKRSAGATAFSALWCILKYNLLSTK